MKLNFFNYIDKHSEEYKPKFTLDWVYYNCDPASKYLQRRNNYRKRMNFQTLIVDEGSDFSVTITFGRRQMGFHLSLRKAIYEQNPDYQSPSI